VELQRRVVRDDRVGRESARQQKRIDSQLVSGGAARHDRVQPAAQMHQMAGPEVLLERGLAGSRLARPICLVRGSEVLEPEHRVPGEVFDWPHVPFSPLGRVKHAP